MPQLPRISIVVPNLNGGGTIERTLQSLVDQGYPDLEILVVDGASKDGSVEIIRSFERHLAWRVSEPDRGQSHAVNKGFARATGEIVNWLCSDDQLAPNALLTVGRIFAEEPEVDVVVGTTHWTYIDGRRDFYLRARPHVFDLLPIPYPFGQPSCFFRHKLIAGRNPPLDESFEYAMDRELWTYFQSIGVRWKAIGQVLSVTINSANNKAGVPRPAHSVELARIYGRYARTNRSLIYWHRLLRTPIKCIGNRPHGFVAKWLLHSYRGGVAMLLAPFFGLRRSYWMAHWAEFP